MIKIGDTFDTDGYGEVVVVDIYISLTSQERVYKVKELATSAIEFLVTGSELQ